MRSDPPRHVLLAEDEDPDVAKVQGILRNYGVSVAAVPRYFEAVAYLKKEAPYTDATRPTLILLDWKLPGGGAAVLSSVRQSLDLREIPVVVLSRSDADVDVRAAYNGYANAFVKKDADSYEFERKLLSICDFFLGVALLPPVPSVGSLPI